MIPLPQPKDLRRNLIEWALLLLTAAIVYLFHLYIDLNLYVRNRLEQELITNKEVIMRNSQAMNDFFK